MQRQAGGGILIDVNHKEIVGDDNVRRDKCFAAIRTILARFDCEMIPEITISPKGMIASVKIEAKPRQMPEQGQANPGKG
jgi:hypothetical protein